MNCYLRIINSYLTMAVSPNGTFLVREWKQLLEFSLEIKVGREGCGSTCRLWWLPSSVWRFCSGRGVQFRPDRTYWPLKRRGKPRRPWRPPQVRPKPPLPNHRPPQWNPKHLIRWTAINFIKQSQSIKLRNNATLTTWREIDLDELSVNSWY